MRLPFTRFVAWCNHAVIDCHRDTKPARSIIMTGTAEGVERRKHQRIGVDGGIFIVMQPDTTKLGQVINLGQEGLAFRYMTDGVQWSGTSRLDLFVVGHDFYLEDIPFATIWDLATGKVVPWGSTTMRQRGLRFGELALPQRSRLAGFMWHQNPTMSLLTRQDS